MEDNKKYIYNEKVEHNILVVGRTDCGKTTFVQRSPLNNLFGELQKEEWISRKSLSWSRESEIQPCFSSPIECNYLSSV